MGLLDKLADAKEATGSKGRSQKSYSNKSGLWVNLTDGDNVVRLGGNLVVCERHYVVDLVDPDALKSSEKKAVLSKNVTCLNWNIDEQKKIDEELHCCPICDLREAANIRRREAKDADNKDLEDKMKEISGKSYARSRYSWDAISRADPVVKTTDADGNESEAMGWKILNLGTEATEAIESLAKQYPQIADPDEGCDVVVNRHKSTRITYGASFALNGPNIHVTPLTDEEKAMEKIDLLRYIASHSSPKDVFESLKPKFQELITDVLGKTADDYPDEAPVPKSNRMESDSTGDSATSAEKSSSKKASSPRRRAASVADEFDEIDESSKEKEEEEEKKPAPPKKPSAPKPPKPPKPPKAAEKEEEEEEEKQEEPEESQDNDDDGDDVKPTCFGYFDEDEAECKKCKQAESCQENS